MKVNRSALDVVGCSEDQALGQLVWQTPWWRHDETLIETIREAVAQVARGEMQQFEAQHISVEGTPVDVVVTLKPFVDDLGEVRLLIVEAHDVSSIKRLEKKLYHSQKMEAFGTLTGGIAHDFNNILGGVMGYAELSLLEPGLEEKIRHNLKGIFNACLRGRDLVAQMLAFSRQEAQDKLPISIQEMVEESLNLVRASVPSSIEIVTDLSAKDGRIMGNSTQLQQVFINLCTNAVHAIGDTGGRITVSTRARQLDRQPAEELGIQPGNTLVITISDTGCGIAPNLLSRIFDPFFTTKDVGKGTGLGLSVVQGIVESFDGVITVESQLGAGSTFSLYFPLLGAGHENDVVNPADPGDMAKENTGDGRHILLVEDEPAVLEVAKAMLDMMGYRVSGYDDPSEALAAYESSPDGFDLVITDLSMPKLRGRELARHIKDIDPQVPVVAWTGFSENASDMTSGRLDFDGLIQKPTSYEELNALLQRLLG